MSTSASSRASYAVEVARLLWPAPWAEPQVTRTGRTAAAASRSAYLFPNAREARLLVPTDLPGSASMIAHLGAGRAGLMRPLRALLGHAVRSRALAVPGWPRLTVTGPHAGADSIERHLSDALGTEVRVGVMLGTRRVNQKPVLPVFGSDGVLLGYAKVGHNDLTAALVRREAEALARLTGLGPRSFAVPRVLHHDRWSGLEVMVLSPLATLPRSTVTPAAQLAAMRELTSLAGADRTPLAGSGFWTRLRAESELFGGADGEALRVALSRVERRCGDAEVTLGGWHGDWGDWNMGLGRTAAGDVLQVWDWERYDSRVPVGFDAVHHAAQLVRPGQPAASEQETAFLAAVPGRLSELGVRPEEHELTLCLYLLEIAARYLDALTHGETPALRRRTSWVLTLLRQRSHHLHLTAQSPSSEGRP